MLRLEGIHYRPVPHLPVAERDSGENASRIVGDLIGAEIAQTMTAHDSPQVDFVMAVSTIMDMPFVSGYLSWPLIAAAIARHTPLVPRGFTASYECAGWGFALDYARRRLPQGGRVLIVVADLNVLDISFWRKNDNWGPSGFGVSTVLLTLPPADQVALSVNVAKSVQGMGEYCADLRKWLSTSEGGRANVPFLPPEMAGIYSHFLPKDRMMRDLHGAWGHCFGSDTWISFIDEIDRGDIVPGSVHCATSASLRGYWALSDVVLDQAILSGFRAPLDAAEREDAA
ncbi:hypothetical protein GGQ68_001021 [Sagittula marina]|uniref:Beta-ketoacyl-[acyl-carrier-protein] synthase III N-terminal domain-containing protein n=1 Tax=Sagittula marina TaxID=943940 RepID=A0A7W6DQ59_9RHOB|nr:hypothetical protein [Sagittula marina]MBB3984705.1 hypothetical protein [Sagittula marina]